MSEVCLSLLRCLKDQSIQDPQTDSAYGPLLLAFDICNTVERLLNTIEGKLKIEDGLVSSTDSTLD